MLLNRTKTYTWDEFMNKSNEHELKKLDKLAVIAEHNKHLKVAMMVFLANLFYIGDKINSYVVYAAVSDPLGKINLLGLKFLGIAQVFGYWICIIMCVVDIIKALMQGDAKGAGKIFVKYLIAFIALFGVKYAFDEVKTIFQMK